MIRAHHVDCCPIEIARSTNHGKSAWGRTQVERLGLPSSHCAISLSARTQPSASLQRHMSSSACAVQFTVPFSAPLKWCSWSILRILRAISSNNIMLFSTVWSFPRNPPAKKSATKSTLLHHDRSNFNDHSLLHIPLSIRALLLLQNSLVEVGRPNQNEGVCKHALISVTNSGARGKRYG